MNDKSVVDGVEFNTLLNMKFDSLAPLSGLKIRTEIVTSPDSPTPMAMGTWGRDIYAKMLYIATAFACDHETPELIDSYNKLIKFSNLLDMWNFVKSDILPPLRVELTTGIATYNRVSYWSYDALPDFNNSVNLEFWMTSTVELLASLKAGHEQDKRVFVRMLQACWVNGVPYPQLHTDDDATPLNIPPPLLPPEMKTTSPINQQNAPLPPNGVVRAYINKETVIVDWAEKPYHWSDVQYEIPDIPGVKATYRAYPLKMAQIVEHYGENKVELVTHDGKTIRVKMDGSHNYDFLKIREALVGGLLDANFNPTGENMLLQGMAIVLKIVKPTSDGKQYKNVYTIAPISES